MLSKYPKQTVHRMPFVQPSSTFTLQIFAKTQHLQCDKNIHDTALQAQNTLKMITLFPLLHISDSSLPTPYHLYFQTHYLVPILPFPEGRESTVWEHSEQYSSLFPLPPRINLNVVPLITTPMTAVYSSLFFLIPWTVSINHILLVGLSVTCLQSSQLQQQYTSFCSRFFCCLKAVSLIWGNPS